MMKLKLKNPKALQSFTDHIHSLIDGSGEDVNISEVTGGPPDQQSFL